MKPFSRLLVSVVIPSAIFCSASASGATLFTNGAIPASEKANMQVAYELNLPTSTPNWSGGPNYTTNNAAAFAAIPYKRIGYYMEVNYLVGGSEYLYVSMDTFDSNPLRIGYPNVPNNNVARQTIVNNANYYSNDALIGNRTGIQTVNLEMWSSNYAGAVGGNATLGGTGAFDWNDSGFGLSTGHGSFQIHDYALQQVLFAHNRWGGAGSNPGSLTELGIGNNTTFQNFGQGIQPDWTFSGSGASGFMQILVQVPEPSRAMLCLAGAALLGLRRQRRQG